MKKRNTQQRREQIISMLNQLGKISVDELTQQFKTSEVTIRKDLSILEDKGLLLRRFGGAVKKISDTAASINDKVSKRKISIAHKAISLINDHSRIIIDSGTTTAALLPHLEQKNGLVVMTNSLHVTNTLTANEQDITLLSTGGTWDAQSHSFQGKMAEQMLRAYNFDQAFIGATGLDISNGTTTFNELTSLSLVMAEVAEQVIVMAESDKLQRKIPNIELPWTKISVLVTDADISASAKAAIEQHGVKVICATDEQQ